MSKYSNKAGVARALKTAVQHLTGNPPAKSVPDAVGAAIELAQTDAALELMEKALQLLELRADKRPAVALIDVMVSLLEEKRRAITA